MLFLYVDFWGGMGGDGIAWHRITSHRITDIKNEK